MMDDEKICPKCGNRSAQRRLLNNRKYIIVCSICGYSSDELPVSGGKDVV